MLKTCFFLFFFLLISTTFAVDQCAEKIVINREGMLSIYLSHSTASKRVCVILKDSKQSDFSQTTSFNVSFVDKETNDYTSSSSSIHERAFEMLAPSTYKQLLSSRAFSSSSILKCYKLSPEMQKKEERFSFMLNLSIKNGANFINNPQILEEISKSFKIVDLDIKPKEIRECEKDTPHSSSIENLIKETTNKRQESPPYQKYLYYAEYENINPRFDSIFSLSCSIYSNENKEIMKFVHKPFKNSMQNNIEIKYCDGKIVRDNEEGYQSYCLTSHQADRLDCRDEVCSSLSKTTTLSNENEIKYSIRVQQIISISDHVYKKKMKKIYNNRKERTSQLSFKNFIFFSKCNPNNLATPSSKNIFPIRYPSPRLGPAAKNLPQSSLFEKVDNKNNKYRNLQSKINKRSDLYDFQSGNPINIYDDVHNKQYYCNGLPITYEPLCKPEKKCCSDKCLLIKKGTPCSVDELSGDVFTCDGESENCPNYIGKVLSHGHGMITHKLSLNKK